MMLNRAMFLMLLSACGDKDTDAEGDDTGSDLVDQAAEDVSGDWEGVCALADYDINIDMVLNQKDRDVTGGADLWFTADKKLEEYDGPVTGTVTLSELSFTIEADVYGDLDGTATYTSDAEAGERMVGTCTDPAGTSGSLVLAR